MKPRAIDRLRDFVKDNPEATAAMAAEALGVSRQRISQLCKTYGVNLARVSRKGVPRFDYVRKRQRPPAPTVVTGGIEVSLSTTACGAISEALVVADLLARGYKPYQPVIRQRSHDIIAISPSGVIATIEVRSARKNAAGSGYIYSTVQRECASEYLAIVATGEVVSYRPDLPVE